MGKENKLPIYEMKVGDPSEDGVAVDFVAVVDEPAIMRGWMKFTADKEGNNKQNKFQFEVTDKERRIITGALMIADLPIYRRDETRGEYYVKFSKDTIENIVKKFAKGGHHNNVNRMHDGSDRPNGIYMIESFIVDKSRGIKTPSIFEEAPDGSWFGSYYVENDELWAQINDGTFTGFSVEGFFELAMNAHKPVESSDLEQALERLAKIL